MPATRTIPAPASRDLMTFTIKVDGEQVPRNLHIEHIEVQKEINKIPFARIQVSDGDPSAETFIVSNSDLFTPGKQIDIALGFHSEETTVFKGLIVTISHVVASASSHLVVECRDAAVKMSLNKNSKHYNEMSDSDIADEIISRYTGIEPQIEATNIVHEDLVQFDVSDWDFVLSRMDTIGRICLVSDGQFKVLKPVLDADVKLEVTYGASMLEYHAEIDARNQYTGIKAMSWDFSGQEVIETEAEEPSWQEGGNISNSSLADNVSGETLELKHSGKLKQEELQAWADAKLLKSRLSKIRGSVKYVGNADVLPGDFIGLNGVGERFSGRAIVNAVTHDCTDNVWTTEVSFGLSPYWYADKVNANSIVEKPGIFHAMQGLQVGVVVNNEDPLGENRVQVKMPLVNAAEDGIWARVATLDAGSQRGTFFRPEVGDEVIVGFISNDPSHAVILGMMHSSANPAPIEATNNNHEKGYVSRSQMKMVFNDDEKSIRIETPGGNKITITMEQAGVTIESATSMKLKAGADLTIEAVNITLSPSASFALSAGGAEIKAGSGTAEVKAPTLKLSGSGITEISGGLVKIN
jgi:Rhs element Vgr protein